MLLGGKHTKLRQSNVQSDYNYLQSNVQKKHLDMDFPCLRWLATNWNITHLQPLKLVHAQFSLDQINNKKYFF